MAKCLNVPIKTFHKSNRKSNSGGKVNDLPVGILKKDKEKSKLLSPWSLKPYKLEINFLRGKYLAKS